MPRILATILILIVAGGCQQEAGTPSADISPQPEPAAVDEGVADVSIYAAAVANPARLDGDADRDAGRQPAAVMEFLGIGRGDHILEMFAGAGYYTELLSHVVGEDGSVTAHVNTPVLNFAGDKFPARHADNRLPNVEILMAENNELSLPADRFDAVTIIQNYHDLYWESEEYGWVRVEVPAFLTEIYKALKPGGTLGIVDHAAETGSPAETGGTLHRIDPAIVIADLEAAGFILDGKTDLLYGGLDDYSKSVFDPAVRGKTDRFVLRFRKPE